MKVSGKELIKQIRNDMGLSQREMAERLQISPRQLSRIEKGESDIDLWQFMALAEALGLPSADFWLLYLETNEYDDYRTYHKIRRFLRNNMLDEAKGLLTKFEESSLSDHPFIRQFVAYAKVTVDREIPYEQAIDELYKAMHLSRPNFDVNKISEYRMTYNEINIAIGIAHRYSLTGELEKSIAITESIIESRESIRATEDDKAALFPTLMYNLSNQYGKVGKYKESLKYCYSALEVCREYNNLRLVPRILKNMASGYKLLGEEEQIYRTHLIRAYHCAFAIGDTAFANKLKENAEEDFGITNL